MCLCVCVCFFPPIDRVREGERDRAGRIADLVVVAVVVVAACVCVCCSFLLLIEPVRASAIVLDA